MYIICIFRWKTKIFFFRLSIHLNHFLFGLLGFSYFIKTCEIFICIQCGTFSALKQGGSLCRKPYRDHVFERINDVLTFYNEYINLFDLQYVLQTALKITYPEKKINQINRWFGARKV